MARQPRFIVPDHPHLLIQRGHLRTPLFVDDDSAAEYLRQLARASRESKVRIHAYGLYVHEIRLLVTPEGAAGLSSMMQALALRHARALNRLHGTAGSPWQGRFCSAAVDPKTRWFEAMLFVENMADLHASTPVVSSVDHHLGGKVVPWLAEHPAYWALGNTPFDREAAYRVLVERGVSHDLARNMRAAAVSGWPIGSPDFLARLTQLAGRRVVPLQRGRPRKIAVPI